MRTSRPRSGRLPTGERSRDPAWVTVSVAGIAVIRRGPFRPLVSQPCDLDRCQVLFRARAVADLPGAVVAPTEDRVLGGQGA